MINNFVLNWFYSKYLFPIFLCDAYSKITSVFFSEIEFEYFISVDIFKKVFKDVGYSGHLSGSVS